MRYRVIFYIPPLAGDSPTPDCHDYEDVDAASEEEAKSIIGTRYNRVQINAAMLLEGR